MSAGKKAQAPWRKATIPMAMPIRSTCSPCWRNLLACCPDPEALYRGVRAPSAAALFHILVAQEPRQAGSSLTVDAVRYHIGCRERTGVCIDVLIRARRAGHDTKVYVQKAHGFGPACHLSTPIIMVGPGTGIAPFRAFLHERAQAPSPGRGVAFLWSSARRLLDFFYRGGTPKIS